MTTLIHDNNQIIFKDGQQVKHYDEGGEFIIHPLFDIAEEKVDTDALGPLQMSGASKWALILLRVYLIFGMLLVLFYVIQVATGSISPLG